MHVINRLKRLSDQLDVIAEVLAIANEVTDAEQRQHSLAAIGRAHDATRVELQAAIDEESKRPKLRLIIGGIGVAAPVGVGVLTRIGRHPVTVAAASTAAAGMAIAGLVLLGVGDPPSYADRVPVGPVSSSHIAPGPADEELPGPTRPATSPTAPDSSPSEADVAYSSPMRRIPATSAATTAPGGPAPSPSWTTTPAPPGTGQPSSSPTWTTQPTANPTAVPAGHAGCLRLMLLSLADADACLLALG